MPESVHAAFCAKIWPFATKARKRSCPERVVSMADAVAMVSRRKVQLLPLQSWKQLLELVASPDAAGAANAQLLQYGWHLLFGQPAVLPPRSTTRH